MAALPTQTDAPYLEALQTGYTELARSERAEFDWVDTADFLARARAAAAGNPAPPVDPATRRVDSAVAPELAAAHAELLGFLASRGAMLRAGRQIGEAQVKYDCWLQEAEEAHQSGDIAECREAYLALMVLVRDLGALPSDVVVVLPEDDGEIGGIELTEDNKTVTLDQAFAASGTGRKLGDLPVAEDEIREAFAGAIGARPKPPVEFTLNFDFGSSRLDDEGLLVVVQAVEEALSREVSEILVTGYADAPGDRASNRAISRSRALRTRREIVRELDVRTDDADRVDVGIRARGERDLIVQTGQPSRPNRRVVILVR